MKIKHLVFLPLMLFATALLCSCSDDSSESIQERGEGTTYRRSVLIYLAAQNSLGNGTGSVTAARLDSAEIASGASRLSNGLDNVFLFIDDDKLPRLYCIYKYGKRTITEKILTWTDDVYSTDPATLFRVLTVISQNYPSESYGLVLWSHGNGWLPSSNTVNTMQSNSFGLRAFGIDVGPGGDMDTDRDASGRVGVQMDIRDMAQAIAKSGVHLDYIFFDACLMQGIEVAYELKDVTDYVVGSANSTSAYGGYYKNLIPKALFAYPANDANVALIANQYYYDAVDNTSLQKYYGNTGNVNSVIKTAGLRELAQATAPLIAKTFAGKATPSLDGITSYLSSQIANAPDYFDMGSAMKNLLSDSDYQTWLQTAKKSVIVHNASSSFIMTYVNNVPDIRTINDKENILGVSMFIPRTLFDTPYYSPFNKKFHSTSWYADAGWNETGW